MKSAHPSGEWAVANASPKLARPIAVWLADHLPVPAPLYAIGAAMVKIHDSQGHLTYLLGHESVRGHNVGAVGFCMGGMLTWIVAAQEGDRVGAAVATPFK